jgi:hypothetical protein
MAADLNIAKGETGMPINMPGTKEWRDEAETDLIDLVRRNDAQNFTVSISCRNGAWRVEVTDHDAPRTEPRSDQSIGEGPTFADAWHGQNPTWAEN